MSGPQAGPLHVLTPPPAGMSGWKGMKGRFGLLVAVSLVAILLFLNTSGLDALWPVPSMLHATSTPGLPSPTPTPGLPSPAPGCGAVASETITPLAGTKHLLVSAFADRRLENFDVRIIGIFRLDSIQPLDCVFCCPGQLGQTPAKVLQHSDHFGFSYGATDIMCRIPEGCRATHVTLVPKGQDVDAAWALNRTFLPIRNQDSGGRMSGAAEAQLNLTVCVSSLFGRYNNVLQFTQALEMYRLLGVNRVVIYNTSCGPDLSHLLHSYSQEGFVEMVPWPIDRHLTPSYGWQPKLSGGDLHYFGQLTTLNECVYRSMVRSRYVLLHDIDEIIMPYQHLDLVAFLQELQQQQPKAGVFLIENHIFPKIHFEPSGRFHLPQWEGVPGVNILEHVYREEPDRTGVTWHPHKIIAQPRSVEQTSVHSVLKSFGEVYNVPPDVCRIIHVRVALQGHLTLDQLHVDKRLWDFSDRLIPMVDQALRRAGMLRSDVAGPS